MKLLICVVFLVLVILPGAQIDAAGLRGKFFDDFQENEDVDEIYDQRQKGQENIRVRVDGVFIAIPAESSEDEDGDNSQSSLASLYQDYLESLAQNGESSSSVLSAESPTSGASNSSSPFADSFLELLEFFPYKKRNSQKHHHQQKEDTHARNKISPSSTLKASEKQLEDVELKPKEIVKNQQRKYKYRFFKYLTPVLEQLSRVQAAVVPGN